jgi:hypothetical protein
MDSGERSVKPFLRREVPIKSERSKNQSDYNRS